MFKEKEVNFRLRNGEVSWAVLAWKAAHDGRNLGYSGVHTAVAIVVQLTVVSAASYSCVCSTWLSPGQWMWMNDVVVFTLNQHWKSDRPQCDGIRAFCRT